MKGVEEWKSLHVDCWGLSAYVLVCWLALGSHGILIIPARKDRAWRQ